MKKGVILLMTLCAVFMAVPAQSPAWEITLDEFAGGAIYEEEASFTNGDLESDWSAFYNKTTLSLADYDNREIEGEAHFGMFLTPSETETWDFNGGEFQTNDMNFWGMDTGIDAGWGFPVELNEETEIGLTPLVGYRWKFMRFSREDFVIANAVNVRETVDEDYNIHALNLGGRFNLRRDKFEIFAKPIFGIVLYSSADNENLGDIDGDGGFLFNLDTGINYSVTEDIRLGLMFTAELQFLEGGESDGVVWPDNSLQAYGGTISLTYRF